MRLATIAGWQGTDLAIIETYFTGETSRTVLAIFELQTGTWRTIELSGFTPAGAIAATDGTTVAVVSGDPDGLVIADGVGATRLLVRPVEIAPGSDWSSSGLSPLPGGGYLVRRVHGLLLLVPPRGFLLESQALPHGYVAVAPTGERDRFVVGPSSEFSGEGGGTSFTMSIWSRSTGAIVHVAGAVTGVAPLSGALIAFERSGSWWRLDTNLSETRLGTVPLPSSSSLVAPSGQQIANVVCHGGATPVVLLGGGCTVAAGPFGHTAAIVQATADNVFSVSWSENDQLALLVGTEFNNSVPLRLVILLPSGRQVVATLPG